MSRPRSCPTSTQLTTGAPSATNSRHGRQPAELLGTLLDALGLTVRFASHLGGRARQQGSAGKMGVRHELIFTRQQGATRYDVRRDLRGPLLEVLEEVQRLLEANMLLHTGDLAGFRQMELPDISWWAAREAVLNAVVHRDYFLHQSIHVSLHEDRIEITSPGGFIGGVTSENVLRHPPVPVTPCWQDVLQAVGLVNRAGLGVDRIFEELLALGKDLPRFEADESHVKPPH